MYNIVWRNSKTARLNVYNHPTSVPIYSARSYATEINKENLDNVAKEFNVTDMSDWYNVPTKVCNPQSLRSTIRISHQNSVLYFEQNTIHLLTNFYHLFTQITNGYLGNSATVLATFGTTFTIKRNSCNGQNNN